VGAITPISMGADPPLCPCLVELQNIRFADTQSRLTLYQTIKVMQLHEKFLHVFKI